jgi:hypothetical protein
MQPNATSDSRHNQSGRRAGARYRHAWRLHRLRPGRVEAGQPRNYRQLWRSRWASTKFEAFLWSPHRSAPAPPERRYGAPRGEIKSGRHGETGQCALRHVHRKGRCGQSEVGACRPKRGNGESSFASRKAADATFGFRRRDKANQFTIAVVPGRGETVRTTSRFSGEDTGRGDIVAICSGAESGNPGPGFLGQSSKTFESSDDTIGGRAETKQAWAGASGYQDHLAHATGGFFGGRFTAEHIGTRDERYADAVSSGTVRDSIQYRSAADAGCGRRGANGRRLFGRCGHERAGNPIE